MKYSQKTKNVHKHKGVDFTSKLKTLKIVLGDGNWV